MRPQYAELMAQSKFSMEAMKSMHECGSTQCETSGLVLVVNLFKRKQVLCKILRGGG